MITSPILLPDNASRSHPASHSGTSTPRHHPDLSKLTRATAEQAGSRNELSWLLVLDNLIDPGEAETRWLDHVGTRLVGRASRPRRVPTRDTAGPLDQRPTESATSDEH